jgi:cellulose synthase/poly-beta-1,6-N-acetylglucosamine synthase-like glycosyltransferase
MSAKIARKSKAGTLSHKGVAYVTHNNLLRHEIALDRFTRAQRARLAAAAFVVLLALDIRWRATVVALIAILTTVYFIDLLFSVWLVLNSLRRNPQVSISDKAISKSRNWPMYTILCPLYREAEVLPQFVDAISKLDYDFKKLQVLLLLESDDRKTINAARRLDLPEYFEILVVPHSLPKTKPKACNFGLKHSVGEYVVIYDAEDVPEPAQLKKAYLTFKKSEKDVACVQAKLNFYNPRQNLLTRAFTAEYSTWFDLILTGLQSSGAPIPLGGTSNHFRTETLRELGGWDVFNVTEDADLGMRLARRGLKTAIVDSVTLEEANSNLKNWFWQRSRWIKGYLQTHLVHSRSGEDYKWKFKHNLAFRLVIGGKVFMMLFNPFLWALTIIYFAGRAHLGAEIRSFFPAPVLYMGSFTLIFGNFLYLYCYMIGCARHGHFNLIKYVFCVPVYWLAMSAAAWRAAYELYARPFHWSKTKHGLHLKHKKAMREVELKLAGAGESS